MKMVMCDMCESQIDTDKPFVEIMVKDNEDQWIPLDLCSRICVMATFGLTDEEPEEAEEDELLTLIDGEDEEDDEPKDQALTFVPRELTPDDRLENEKRYRAQAAEMTAGMTGVTDRTMGQR